MNSQEIKDFLKSIRETDIEELNFECGDDLLYFKKNHVEASKVKEKEEPVKEKEKPNIPKSTITAIKSAMVGTFAITPSNDKPPFVKEGDSIKKGQKVGQIEAMKIIKDVNSNVSGKIVKIVVSNGQAVEYGQELYLVDTSK